MSKRMLGGMMTLALVTSLAAGQAVETRGVIDAVTVYRGQALVTRVVDVPAARESGVSELVVTELPARIIPSSLHADSGGDLQVRSVRYRTRPVAQDVRKEVREAEQKIDSLKDQQVANARRGEVLNERKQYLASLQAFVAPTAQTELTRGVLNAETLERLSDYITSQREEIAMQELERLREAKGLEASLELANRELQALTAGSQKTVQEAVLLVGGNVAAGGKIKLHYLVEGATWEPSYTARAGAAQEGLTLEYYAAIEQLSGEDWEGVQMKLSTATPSLVAAAPKLTPMRLTLGAPTPQQVQEYWSAREELSRKQEEVTQRRNLSNRDATKSIDARVANEMRKADDQEMNRNAMSMQVLELVAGTRDDKGGRGTAAEPTEGLSITYTLADRTSLPSRYDRQQIQIATMALKATFSKVASPVLTNFVYDEARLTNTSSMVLLAGPLTSYVNGAFVGTADLPTITSGESFVVGLGIDSSLRATRELVERTDQIQGGNRIVEITYRLVIENFSKKQMNVRVFDRLPKSEDGQVKVTLVSGPELSTDSDYSKSERKEGILRYDVSVPAEAAGEKAFSVEYKFRLEHDKQMNLTGM